MKSIIAASLLVSALFSLCYCQISLPSDAELEELLSDPKRVSETVNCVIQYNPATCDPRTKDAYDLAPEYFSTQGNCRACSPDVLRKVRRYLQRLQKQYRKEYQRLLSAVSN